MCESSVSSERFSLCTFGFHKKGGCFFWFVMMRGWYILLFDVARFGYELDTQDKTYQ